MFGNMFAGMDFQRKLHKLFNRLHAQEEITACTKCSFCCWQKPCNLKHGDLEKIAKFLKITPKKLFRQYLCVDTAQVKDFSITPIRKEWKSYAGEYIPSNRTYDIDTPCIFLDEETKLCKIHDVKPGGGKGYECWNNESNPNFKEEFNWTKAEIKKYGWDGNDNEISDDEYWRTDDNE